MSTFTLTYEHDGSLSVDSAVFQALGYASMCWEETPKGIFQSDDAKQCGDVLLEFLRAQEKPNLGLATTGELIGELAARAQLNGYSNYRTVDRT